MNDEKTDKREQARKTEKQIVSAVSALESLLEKRQAEEKVQTSLVANCESAGSGLRACNPLMPGHCPPEADFESTFKDMPWSNIFTKNQKTDAMERCVPSYLIGRPTASKMKTRDDLSLEERLLRAVNTLERSYSKLQDASEFQWTTPCEDAQNEAQCNIMRDEPTFNKVTGSREFTNHGTRCYWRPTQDPTYKDEAGSDQKLCRPFADSIYRPIPMTQKYIDDIKDQLKDVQIQPDVKDVVERSLKDLKVSDPYGNVRTRLANAADEDVQYRDLTKAYVQLPLFPITEVLLASANAVANHHTYLNALRQQKKDDNNPETKAAKKAVFDYVTKLAPNNLNKYLFSEPVRGTKYTDTTSSDALQKIFEKSYLSRKSNKDGYKAPAYLADDSKIKVTPKDSAEVNLPDESDLKFDTDVRFNYTGFHKAVAEHVKDGLDLCDKNNEKKANKYSWETLGNFNLEKAFESQPGATNTFLYSLLLPSTFNTAEANEHKQLYDRAAGIAKKDWWKFVHAALTSQRLFESDLVTLVERLYAKLKSGTLLKNLLLKRTEGHGDKKKTVFDITSYKGLIDGINTAGLVDEYNKYVSANITGSQEKDKYEDIKDDNYESVVLKKSDGKEFKETDDASDFFMLDDRQMFKDLKDSDAAKDQRLWELATIMAVGLVQSSARGIGRTGSAPGGAGDRPIFAKALHKAGVAGDPQLRWQAKIGAEVHVASTDANNETDEERRDRLREAEAKIKRLAVARELRSALQRELDFKRGNRVIEAVRSSLAATRTPEQRYQRAISFIPSLVEQAKKADSGVSKDDIFKMVTAEIKRRFSTPPHPLFYNEKTKIDDKGKVEDLASCAESNDTATLRDELACRYIKEAEDVAASLEDKKNDMDDITEKLKEMAQSARASRSLDRAKSRLSDALNLEEKYGSGSYVDVKHRSFEPLSAIEDHVSRLEGP